MTPPSRDPEQSGMNAAGGDEVALLPWPALFRRRVEHRVATSGRQRWWVLWTALAGLFAVNVTFTVFAVALPRLAARPRVDREHPHLGHHRAPAGLRRGRPRVGPGGRRLRAQAGLPVRLVGALVAAVLTAVAWSAGSLIAARVLGGVEGAATGAASMAMIFRAFPPDDRVKAMGYWSLVGAGGPVIGVVIGGFLIEQVGWRWIFVAQVPLILAALVLALVVLPETERTERGRARPGRCRHPHAGAVVGVLFALNRGPEWGWTHPLVLVRLRARRRWPRPPSWRSSGGRREPLLPLRLPAAPQLRLPHRRPGAVELRLHGRLHPGAAAAGQGVRLRRAAASACW